MEESQPDQQEPGSVAQANDAPRPDRLVKLRIRRQHSVEQPATRRWDLFEVPLQYGMTVADALLYIECRPVTADGRSVAPVAWEGHCLEGTCGGCTMLVNGRVRQACTTGIEELSPERKPVVLAPMSRFPLVRDLVVERSSMFEALARLGAWLEVDTDRSPLPVVRQSPAQQREALSLSSCTHCGACLEACPRYGDGSEFVGAAALNQVRFFNTQPAGSLTASERLEAVMAPGGITGCGKAQNCVESCPVGVPLVDSIQHLSRDTTRHMILGWLLK